MLFQLYGCTTELRKYVVQAKETMWVCIASEETYSFRLIIYVIEVPIKHTTYHVPHTPC